MMYSFKAKRHIDKEVGYVIDHLGALDAKIEMCQLWNIYGI